MKNTVFQAVAPKAPTVIPPPPGGGSWRWDGIKWVANTPAAATEPATDSETPAAD